MGPDGFHAVFQIGTFRFRKKAGANVHFSQGVPDALGGLDVVLAFHNPIGRIYQVDTVEVADGVLYHAPVLGGIDKEVALVNGDVIQFLPPPLAVAAFVFPG